MAALALIAMCFVDCNSSVAMVVLCISVGISGCAYSGSCLTELDIAPNLAGTLTGITNTLGSATGFLAPAIAGAITMNNVSGGQVACVLLLKCCVFFRVLSALCYFLFNYILLAF